MNGHMCYPCLEKDYYAISADNFRLINNNENLRKELESFSEGYSSIYKDRENLSKEITDWERTVRALEEQNEYLKGIAEQLVYEGVKNGKAKLDGKIIIIDKPVKPCDHSECGDAYDWMKAVLRCTGCGQIVEAKESHGEYCLAYWKVRSDKWLARKLKKVSRREARS
jgi:hypothetical protein